MAEHFGAKSARGCRAEKRDDYGALPLTEQAPTHDPYDFQEFCNFLAPIVGVEVRKLVDSRAIVDDLALDEISMASLILGVQELNPYFIIPRQMDVADLTVDDLYHYYSTMTEHHVDR